MNSIYARKSLFLKSKHDYIKALMARIQDFNDMEQEEFENYVTEALNEDWSNE